MPEKVVATPARASLGEQLVASGKLSPAGLERATRLHAESSDRLEILFSKLGPVPERDLAEAMAVYLELPLLSSKDFPDTPVCEDRLSRKFLTQARLVPIEERAGGLVVAMADPFDDFAVEAVRFAIGKPVLRCVAYPADVDAALQRLYGDANSSVAQALAAAEQRADEGASDDIERLKDQASEAPVIRLVNLLIQRAVEARASDIHIEPVEDRLRVRYRIDGVLSEVESPPQRLRAAVVSRIKIMARLNIAERRLSQDGRIRLAVRGRDIDFRISTIPTIHGEKVVLRILDRSGLTLDFDALGFEPDVLRRYNEALSRPHGILLVTGPTGSGKTTTLYTSLLSLNTPEKNILTIEDPVEYQLDGVSQVQVKPQIGLTFASALRSFLRQDPDIMMIGEIRDLETAQIAVQTALTGHLILSTLHTNDAASGVTRLLDMGVEDYLLTSTVNALVGQRLVRTLCPHCRAPYPALPELVSRLQLDRVVPSGKITLFQAVGCEQCGGTGYHGRTSILEVLIVSERIRQLVLQHAESRLIQRAAVEEGMQTMQMHGMRKAVAGATTVEEVLRVIRDV